MIFNLDLQDDYPYVPKRGDLAHTNCGDRRERTWFILHSHKVKRRPGLPQ